VGVDINSLTPTEQDEARNVTSEIFVVQQGNETVQMHLEPTNSTGVSPNSTGVGGIPATGGTQDVTLPYPTTPEGDFDVFVPIQLAGLTPGNQTQSIQMLNTYATNATLGNATAYLVPPTGFTVVSDIDDILRVTQIYLPKNGLLNSFAYPYVPWLNMPDIYSNWSKSIPNMHFHYLTTTPEQITRNYMDFIYYTYPGGSFDTRPLNFSDVNATLSIRKFMLDKIFQTFPQRKFILVADTSNADVMRDYPQMAIQYPGQVQCIFLRNTSATDKDYLPYDTSGFKNLSQSQYMFFITPNDLMNLDIVGGNCYNSTVKQNITFGEQDELLGIHGSGAANLEQKMGWAWLAVSFVAAFVLFL
jgi:phosphatidate phosphatase APP1